MNNDFDSVKIKGTVRTVHLDENHNIIPGTEQIGNNGIQTGMLYYLARALGNELFDIVGSAIVADSDFIIGHTYMVTVSDSSTHWVKTNVSAAGALDVPINHFFTYTSATTVTFGASGAAKDTEIKPLNNLFATSSIAPGDFVGDGQVTLDGIAYDALATGAHEYQQVFATTLNQGGDGATSYIEFYGELYNDGDSVITLLTTGALCLGRDLYDKGSGFRVFRTLFSTYSYADTLAVGRRLGVYWRITLSV